MITSLFHDFSYHYVYLAMQSSVFGPRPKRKCQCQEILGLGKVGSGGRIRVRPPPLLHKQSTCVIDDEQSKRTIKFNTPSIWSHPFPIKSNIIQSRNSSDLLLLVYSKIACITNLHTFSLAMPFQYKKVLVIGATSGIGRALASRFVQEGSSVIVVGRRKENLEAFVHEHGKDKASAVPFDTTELDKIPNFVTKSVFSCRPDSNHTYSS